MTPNHLIAANPFIHQAPGQVTPLPACDQFEAAHHLWSQAELDALALAWAARRPLLVRGEPGSGKSQLARAAAVLLQTSAPLVQMIHPRFEPRDLLYRFDTLRRLSDANTPDALKSDAAYVIPGKLWQAFERCNAEDAKVVLLIDEIDKADADVPNSLLDVLGHRSFQVDEAPKKTAPRPHPKAMPLIVITTNEERELPAAFVRRCVVLNLNPPQDADGLRDWLAQRVQAHAHLQGIDETVKSRALQQVLADREVAVRAGYPPVGLAETLDLLTALGDITAHEPEATKVQAQNQWLDRLSAYALVKSADVQPGQRRAPVAAESV